MSGKPFVAVLGVDGKPLMPCTGKRARLLLEKRRARIVRVQPFVIRLLDRTQDDCEVQDMAVKIDPGSKHTGVAVARVSSPGVLHVTNLIELQHRGKQISLKLKARSELRRGRRNRNTRYRPVRFLNRTKSEGWLPPSLRHRIDTTLSWVTRLMRWFPITELAVERVKFDMQKLRDPLIAGIGYQQGTLQGFEIREYLLEKWQRKCAYCDTSTVTRFEVDHFIARVDGGSNAVSNLVLACHACNQAKGAKSPEDFLAHDPERLSRIRRQLKTPLHDAAAVNATRNALLIELLRFGLPVETGTGGQTKFNRIQHRLPKTHALDAICVGAVSSVDNWERPHLEVKCSGRGRYCRTALNKHGFPRLYYTRKKNHAGFQTGDLVKAWRVVESRFYSGSVAVRASLAFVVDTGKALVAVTANNCQRVQRADGYKYRLQAMVYIQSLDGHSTAVPI